MEIRKEIIKELDNVLSSIEKDEIDNFKKEIEKANRIFFAGQGRSGFMMRGFAMRLMHLGKTAFVIGETTTPAIMKGDLLIIGSGSGETGSLVNMAKKVKEIGANLALVTTNKDSSIAKLSDAYVVLKAQAKGSEESTSTVQPMGSLFEQSLLLFNDSIIFELMEEMKQNGSEMFNLHANLE